MFFAVQPENDWVVSTGFAVLRPQVQMIAPRFLYACVFSQTFTEYLVSREKGAAYPAVSPEDIGNAVIPLPPLKEQAAIASILGALDDKIELNQTMNQTLEATARTIFKSWFVDFDPVRAKAAGQPPPGLKPEIAALFPDSLDDSELGEIPKGWKILGLSDIATFLNGLALQKYPPGDGGSLPVIKIAQLRKGSTEDADRAGVKLDASYIVDDGDVLFSWSGSLECVLWTGGRGALNQHLFKVTSDCFSKWFYYLWIHEHLPAFRHIAAAKATTMGHIQRHHLAEAKVVIPSSMVLRRANQIIEPLIDAAISRSLECRQLAMLRDTLLPALVSGQLTIADAERIAGRAR